MSALKVAFFICVALTLSPTASWAADKTHGVFMIVKGTVQVQSPGKSLEKAKVGAKVFEGDKIITAADSRAKIVMSDRNVLNLSPETSIQIEVYKNDPAKGTKNVEIKLSEGKLRSNVEQVYNGERDKFQVKTPTAVAGVRGTQFQTSFNSKTLQTSIVAFKGSVAVAAINTKGKTMGAPVIIKRGEMTTTAPGLGAPSAPSTLPTEEINQIEKESIVSQNQNADGSKKSEPSTREVASNPGDTASRSMIDANDMDLGIAKDIKPISAPAARPTANPAARAPQADTTLRDLIRSNGKTKTVIRPQPK